MIPAIAPCRLLERVATIVQSPSEAARLRSRTNLDAARGTAVGD